jgi:hypothetical protein
MLSFLKASLTLALERDENVFRHLISCATIVWKFSELPKAFSELQ